MKYIGPIIMIFMLGFYFGFMSEREKQPPARTIDILFFDGQQWEINPPILLSDGQEYELKAKNIASWSDTEITATIN